MRTRIVHVDQPTFQSLPTSPWPNILNQIRHSIIGEGHRVAYCLFGHIKKAVDSVYRPKDRKQAFFSVKFLFDALKKLITRRDPDRIMERIKEEAQFIPSDNPS
jgi:hypothetical protein